MGEKLWSKGEGAEPDEAVEAFTVGDDPEVDAHILADDCWASIAHAAALHRAGILAAEELATLQDALLALIDLHARVGVPIARSQEDCHTAIEQLLVERLGAVGKKIHTGRSRNDQVLTALRLYVRRRLMEIVGRLHALAEVLLHRAEAGLKTPMRGLTHTRPAMPTTLAVYLGAWVEALLDDATLLRTAFALNDRSPLGSAAGYGSPLPLDRELTRELLGFADLQVNALYCQNSRGKVEGTVLFALESAQDTLAKLAGDLILFSAPDLAYLSLPVQLTTGSSIMPQKRNPDVLELVRARAGVVTGAAAQVRAIAGRLISGYHRDYQLLKAPLIRALATVAESLDMMGGVADAMVFDEEALAASCSSDIYAADLALERAREGTPFRDAYRTAMAELEGLTVDRAFVLSRIAAYQTLGAMGNPGLDRYRGPLDDLARWLADGNARLREVEARLRSPLD